MTTRACPLRPPSVREVRFLHSTQGPSVNGWTKVSGFLVLTTLLFSGCSSSPGSSQSATGEVVITAQATPTSAQDATPSVTASIQVEPSPSMKAAQAPQRSGSPQLSAPPDGPARAVVTSLPPLGEESTPTPRPEATKAAPLLAAPTATVAPSSLAVDIGGLVEVSATKPGLVRIGSVKCKLCHKVQFDSWSKTPHATRAPPLDCESCHGSGSEYKTLAIMKDAQKARSAGLVMPVRAFCAKCHTRAWSDDLLKRAHAHKAGV